METHVIPRCKVSETVKEAIALAILTSAAAATLAGLLTGAVSPDGAVFVGGGMLVISAIYFAAVSRYRHVFPVWSIAIPLGVLGLVAAGGRISGLFGFPAWIIRYDYHIAAAAAAVFVVWVIGVWVLLEYYLLPMYEDVKKIQQNRGRE